MLLRSNKIVSAVRKASGITIRRIALYQLLIQGGTGTYRLEFVPSIELILCRECWIHIPSSTVIVNRFVHIAWDCVYKPWQRIRFVLLQLVLQFLSDWLGVGYLWQFYGLCFRGRREGRLYLRPLYGSTFVL
jgi:hypothetical protein